MKLKIALLASLLTIGLGTTFATTTDALMLTAGGLTATISDNGGCVGTGCGTIIGDINPTTGITTATGSIDGWSISVTSGTSYSPSDVPVGLDLTSVTASCVGGPCTSSPLDVQFSDINFSPSNPSFTTTYSGSATGSGSTTQSAYYSNSNALFSTTSAVPPSDGLGVLIGTVGPFSGSFLGEAAGGVGSVAPYSLTLDQIFTSTGSGVFFSVDGFVQSVPEPGALILFGTVLVLCASKLRRHRAS